MEERRAASIHFAQTTCQPTCSILVTLLVLPVPRPSSQGQARWTFSGRWQPGAPAGRCPPTRPIRGLVPGVPPPGQGSQQPRVLLSVVLFSSSNFARGSHTVNHERAGPVRPRKNLFEDPQLHTCPHLPPGACVHVSLFLRKLASLLLRERPSESGFGGAARPSDTRVLRLLPMAGPCRVLCM